MISNKYVFIEPRLGEARETLADITKIFEVFSWKPINKLEQYIQSEA